MNLEGFSSAMNVQTKPFTPDQGQEGGAGPTGERSAGAPLVFMFSGQGSQYPGMGRTLYAEDPVFRRWMHRLDEIAAEEIGESVIRYIYPETARPRPFDHTLITHPAIFMVEYALARTLIEKGVRPDMVLGSSLGEVVAAAIAEMLDVEAALRFVSRQAKVFDELCPVGGMTAVLHSAEIYAETPVLHENCELAGVNYTQHFVMSGSRAGLEAAEAFLRGRDISVHRLPVSHAFHSSLIEPAKRRFLALLDDLPIRAPRMPFVSCTASGRVETFAPHYFWDVVRNPINTMDTVRALLASGERAYVDIGPSGTMCNFIKYNADRDRVPKTFLVLQPYGNEVANLRTLTEYAERMRKAMTEIDVKKTAYLFPGQGSQFKGMGKDLFDRFPEMTAKADAVLGYSIRTLCVDDPEGKLGRTEYTQPAIYVVSVLSYLKLLQEGATLPDFFAGHSLGEYAALYAAGVFDFETGLKLVSKRGALMSAASGGGMAAILQLTREAVARVIEENGLSAIDIANLNTPQQCVIAGPVEVLNKAQEHFQAAGGMFIPLNVSAPFHSRYMEPSMIEFGAYLESFTFDGPKVPVISNVHVRPYGASSDEIKDNLKQQIRSPVRWVETIWYMTRSGVETFKELGPGDVLTKMLAHIRRHGVPDDFRIETQQAEATVTPLPVAASKVPAEVRITAAALGSPAFKRDYGVKHAYYAGAMYKGIASKELVVRMGKAGYLSFFGAGGLSLTEVENTIRYIRKELPDGQPYGMNLLCSPSHPEFELETARLYLKHEVRRIEASAFMNITPALVLYRLAGLSAGPAGQVVRDNKIIAKISRPEVAKVFLEPAPARIVEQLLAEGAITAEQVALARKVPMADDLCVESDSGGHTDMGVTSTLLPTIIRLRDQICAQFAYADKVRVGSAGGIGTPEAAASAFLLGAEFIVTGSVNQCTPEAGTSDVVKDMLQKINVQDTDYAPAGDMFELGAKVQVMKRGVFFAARANKLYELWKNYNALEEIDEKTRQQIQEKYFKKSFDQVYADVREYYGRFAPEELEKAEKNPKIKMALIFRWYFGHGTRLALNGDQANRVDFQVQCGPALGAFNQWIAGTELEDWRNRHVDTVAEKIMTGTAELLNARIEEMRAMAV